MKKIQTISLMVMALTLAACNEKVSPELQDANVVAPPPPVVEQDSFTFKVTTTSDPSLEYLLHKTGATFKPDPILTSDDCEVSKRVSTFARADFGKSQNDIDPTDPSFDPAEMETLSDITCYLEAEELGLYMDGLKLKVEATPGACTYIRYSPFSYYNRKSGNSSATYKKVSCAPDTDATHIAAEFPVVADITYTGGFTADCNEYLIDSRKASNNVSNIPVTPAERTVFRVDSNDETADLETEDQLCRFNYEDLGEEQCDVGEITVNDHLVAYNKTAAELDATSHATAVAIGTNSNFLNFTDLVDDGLPGSPDDGTAALIAEEEAFILATAEFDTEFDLEFDARLLATLPTFTTKTITKRTINCGGRVNNCVEGPIKTHASITTPGGALISNIISTASAYSQEYSYGTLNPTRQGTYVYANFRRELANSNIDYPLNLQGTPLDPIFAQLNYLTAFDPGGIFGSDVSTFEPRLMDRYTSNREYQINNAPLVDPVDLIISNADWETASLEGGKFGARPYAAEAYLGLGSYKGFSNRTNPYYTFECLNNARETTARIRVLVRDWDRLVPLDTTTTEYISDISLGSFNDEINTGAFQDNTSFKPLSNGYEEEQFNDFVDWDDIIRFTRAPGPLYTPPGGFLSTQSFPQENRKP